MSRRGRPGVSTQAPSPVPPFEPTEAAQGAVPVQESKEEPAPKAVPWPKFLETASDNDVRDRFAKDLAQLAPGPDSGLAR